jgi:hypothetical protein
VSKPSGVFLIFIAVSLNFSRNVTILTQKTNKQEQMTILTIIGVVVLIVLLFVGGGLLGWLIKGLEVVFTFLSEGCSHTLGCLFWIFIVFCALIALIL